MRIPTSADFCRLTLELLDRGLQLRQEEREEEVMNCTENLKTISGTMVSQLPRIENHFIK